MDPETAYAEGAGRFLPYGVPHTYGAATIEGMRRRLVLPPSGGFDGGGRVTGGGDLCLPPPEHSGAMYCD